MRNKIGRHENGVHNGYDKMSSRAERLFGCVALFALLVPFFVSADILDEPFFLGALGRSAYFVPVERIYHTQWENELRFSFPSDTGVRVQNFVENETARASALVRDVWREASALAATSRIRLAAVAENMKPSTIWFKADRYAAATGASVLANASQHVSAEHEQNIVYVEEPPTPSASRCSRSAGLARYTWCLMDIQSVF